MRSRPLRFGKPPPQPRRLATALLALVVAFAGSAAASPAAGGEPAGLRIHDIQGAGHTSPLAGRAVAGVQGIVTARRANGFYVQDPRPDDDERTSEAVFVFTASAPAVAPGDAVSIGGRVSEFRPQTSPADLSVTEIVSPQVTLRSSGNALPTPVLIGVGGRLPPHAAIAPAVGDVSESGDLQPDRYALDFFASLEGMLVQVNDPVVVGPRSSFGEIAVLADDGAGSGGRRTARGGLLATAANQSPARIILDDEILKASGEATPMVDVGDRFRGPAAGVIDYSFGNFKLELTQPLTAAPGGLQRQVAPAAAADQLAIGTFNVENLSPASGAAKFARLAGLIVDNLRAPDILAVEEIQDDDGPADSGVTNAGVTVSMLTDAIMAAGGPVYASRSIAPQNDADGGQPGGNIRSALLFRTDRGLAFVDRPGGDATTPAAVISDADGVRLSFSPGRVDPQNPAWRDSRKPLAGEFTFAGRRLFVIANHFVAKLGDQPLFGRFQPPARPSEAQRMQQALALNAFVAQLLAADANAAVVVLGDLNDFEYSPAVAALAGDVLHDLVLTLPENERYTYEFEGNAQALDHILLSDALFAAPLDYGVVHVNAEFADHASDHDPQIVRLATGCRHQASGIRHQ